MFKINWICCLETQSSFVGIQADIFNSSESIYYDEYYETLIGIEKCSKCQATYASYMVVEFTIPKIYFHIPISQETYDRFKEMEVILKDDLFNSKEKNLVLVEREINNQSIWEWQNITVEMWSNI